MIDIDRGCESREEHLRWACEIAKEALILCLMEYPGWIENAKAAVRVINQAVGTEDE